MYRCLKNPLPNHFPDFELVPIRKEDIENIRIWRNEQMDVLRQSKTISEEEQKNYFERNVFPLFKEEKPSQILFSFLFKKKCIGYGGLTNIYWDYLRAEISFLQDTNRKEEIHDFFIFLSLISQVAFNDLDFHRLHTETFAFRTLIIEQLVQFGFQLEGILKQHVFKKNQWFDSHIHGLLKNDFRLQ